MSALAETEICRVVVLGDQSAQLSHELFADLLDKGYQISRIGLGEPVEEQGTVIFEEKDWYGLTSQEVLDLIEKTKGEGKVNQPGNWKPWFPVIDYDRCTNCMQCLSFCLFDVYGVDEQNQIQVQNQDNCKTNCPACSRVCPEVAIMFPKYASGPINGDEVSAEDVGREKMKVDISALLGGDVYSALRNRSEKAQSRFAKERDSERALKERQKCLNKLSEGGFIPPEVLAALPSQEEIEQKAIAAKEKARIALENKEQS
ncbi:MAG: ferredoxin family protein [Verrucomicrobiota bacterium]